MSDILSKSATARSNQHLVDRFVSLFVMSTNCLELCRCPKRFSCTASSSSSSQTRLHRQRKLYARPQRRSLPSQSYSASAKPLELSRLHPRCHRTACCRMQKVMDQPCTAREPRHLLTARMLIDDQQLFQDRFSSRVDWSAPNMDESEIPTTKCRFQAA